MVKETYESPKMTFEEVMADEAVANTCWGHHSSGKVQYADIPGAGFMSFQIENGSCALNLTNVQYYKDYADYKDDNQGTLCKPTDPEDSDSYKHYKALSDVLKNSGGSDGNPYKGEGTITKDKPITNWS